MAAPTVVAVGTESAGTTSCTPGLPAGWAADDIFEATFECNAADVPTIDEGWTEFPDSPQATTGGAATTNTKLVRAWKRATSSESAKTFSNPAGNHIIGQIQAIRGCPTTGDPFDVTAGSALSTADTAVSIPGDTTTVADCLISAAVSATTDTNTDQFSSPANADLTSVTERMDAFTTTAQGGGFAVVTGVKASAGAFGATTGTLATTSKQGLHVVAYKPDTGAAASGGSTSTITVVATGAGSPADSGGSTSTITVVATGAGSPADSGGSTSSITVVSSGAGIKGALGGTTSTITVVATGAGEGSGPVVGGGSTATVVVTSEGAGSQAGSGGATSSITVVGTGAGSQGAAGGATSSITVVVSGAGFGVQHGGSTSTITVVASGAGSPQHRGGSTSTITVVATGAGQLPQAVPGQLLRWLGGNIDVRVEVDTGLLAGSGDLWGTGEWGAGLWGAIDPQYQDITSYVLRLNTRAGKARWDERFQAGSATINLDNTTGIFTPNPPVPVPWVLPWRPGRRIRVVVLPDPDDPDLRVPLFTGVIDSPAVKFDQAGADVVAQVTALDYMAVWAASQPGPLSSPTGVQLTSDRVQQVLDRAGWPALERDIQTGLHSCQPSLLEGTTLEECLRAAEAEGGAFFCDASGKAVFKARDWLAEDARSIAPQGFIGFDPGSLASGEQLAHVLAVDTSWDLARVFNDVQMQRTGGTLQRVQDATSQADYGGRRTYSKTGLINSLDSQVLLLALRFLEVFKQDRLRIDSVAVVANDDPDNLDLNQLFYDSQFGDQLEVKVRTLWGWELAATVHLMGLNHTITPDDWLMSLAVDDAATFIPAITYWRLGHAGESELGVTTVLGPP